MAIVKLVPLMAQVAETECYWDKKYCILRLFADTTHP